LRAGTALVTKVAFLRNRIDHLNDAKGASDCASFTTNTFLFVQLYAISLKSQSINRTSRNAGGIVAMMAGHWIRSLALPNNVDTGSKVTVTQRPVFLIVCHRTGNFTSMTAYTFRSFSSDKLIHLHPFHLMSYVFSNFAMQ
jgi:hypothetical protein